MSTTTTVGFIVAFRTGQVWIGPLNSALSRVGTTGLNGQDVASINLVDSTGRMKVWAVDGADSIIVDVAGGTVTPWTASAGIFPIGCALAAAYRGRAVLARQRSNPSVWYASRALNPQDWDFGQDDAEAAVAGSNARVGQPTDPIMALMKGREDYLVMGCQSSIWSLIGDPGESGQILAVSHEIGVLGPRAWCYAGRGRLFFLGPAGLYEMTGPDQVPKNISGAEDRHKRARVPELTSVDPDLTHVHVVYNAKDDQVHILLTPRDGVTVGVHWVYSVPSDAFWPDDYPLAHGPTAACSIAGGADEDRAFVFGGADGFIRRPWDAALGDDGSAITSYVDPFVIHEEGMETLVSELQAYGFPVPGAGAVSWQWFTADTPDAARQATSSPRASGTMLANLPRPDFIGLRAKGAAHKLRITQTSAIAGWGLERLVIAVEAANRRR